MAPPSVNTHTHTHWTLPTIMSVLETPFYIHVSSVYQTHTCMLAPIPTLCISAKKTHNKGSRTRPIMSTLMPRSGIPVICSGATLSCDSSYLALIFYLSTDFQNFCGTFYDFWNAKQRYFHILMEIFQYKVICKRAIAKGWCKESRGNILTRQ